MSTMYAVKGSWAGQTFALATTSNSGGRKSRIRRSKEERKAMVESFTQRYQSSNDGSFPSLNLTHKEVGGSFYIVREIVREIIQENRVLGPAKYSPVLDRGDAVMTEYPLGSISLEPQNVLGHEVEELKLNFEHKEAESKDLSFEDNGDYINHQELELFKCAGEPHTHEIIEYPDVLIANYAQYEDPKPYSENSCRHLSEDEIDKREFVNGLRTEEICDDSGQREVQQLPIHDILEADNDFAVVGESKALPVFPTEEIAVEAFPLRLRNKGIEDVARLSTEFRSVNDTLSDSKSKADDLNYGTTDLAQNNTHVASFHPIDTDEKDSSGDSTSSQGSNMESELEVNGTSLEFIKGQVIIAAADIAESPLIVEGNSVLDDRTYQIASHSGLESGTSVVSDEQPNDTPVPVMCLDDRNATSIKCNDREPVSVALNGNGICRDNKAVASTSPPLDRINLQSWERTVSKQQANPLLAVFKAFVDAFVKFWS